jgi:hypothetical protein
MATKTIAEVEANIDVKGDEEFDAQVNAAIMRARSGIERMTPVARLGFLAKALQELGLPTEFLAQAHEQAARAQGLRRQAMEAQQQAATSRVEAQRQLTAEVPASLDAVAAVYQMTEPWLRQSGDGTRPPAVQMVHDAARAIEAGIDSQIMLNSERIFALAQRKANELVAEIKALPAFPESLWHSAVPAEDLSRIQAHRGTWGLLSTIRLDFESTHRIANLVRDGIGAGPDSLPDGAPRHALTFRNWRPLLDDTHFGRLKPELRLPYSISQGYDPGCWHPRDVETTEADASFWGKLRNLGQAVG